MYLLYESYTDECRNLKDLLVNTKLIALYNNEELFCGKFDTYGSVLSCLELMEFMFSRALDELDKSSVKNKKNKKEEK